MAECRLCTLKFQSTEAYDNHKRRFCPDSKITVSGVVNSSSTKSHSLSGAPNYEDFAIKKLQEDNARLNEERIKILAELGNIRQEANELRNFRGLDRSSRREDEVDDSLMAEIKHLTQEYLTTGGTDPGLMNDLKKMETDASRLEGKKRKLMKTSQETPIEEDDLELKELKRQHAKRILLLTFEKERLLCENEVEKIRRDLPARSDLDAKTTAPPLGEREALGNILEDIDALPTPPYIPENGFVLFFDYASGFPSETGKNVQLAYALFDGSKSKSDVRVLKPMKCNMDSTSGIIWAGFSTMRDFKQNIASDSLRVLIELRLQTNSGDFKPLAWTVFNSFTENGTLDHGRWRLPLFSPPIDFNLATTDLYSREPQGNFSLFLRVFDAALLKHHAHISMDLSHRIFYRKKTYAAGTRLEVGLIFCGWV